MESIYLQYNDFYTKYSSLQRTKLLFTIEVVKFQYVCVCLCMRMQFSDALHLFPFFVVCDCLSVVSLGIYPDYVFFFLTFLYVCLCVTLRTDYYLFSWRQLSLKGKVKKENNETKFCHALNLCYSVVSVQFMSAY